MSGLGSEKLDAKAQLADEQNLLANAKKLTLFVAGAATQKYAADRRRAGGQERSPT
jgi:hypothetical protein